MSMTMCTGSLDPRKETHVDDHVYWIPGSHPLTKLEPRNHQTSVTNRFSQHVVRMRSNDRLL